MGTAEVCFSNSFSRPLNRASARLGIFESYDGIACFVDKSSDEALEDSEADLKTLLSDPTILQQPIVILVRTENASEYASDSDLLSEFELGDVIKEREGRVSVFAYSLSSPTQFVGCAEGQRRNYLFWN